MRRCKAPGSLRDSQPAGLRADPGIHWTVGDRIRPHDQHVPRVGRDDQLVLCWWESDGEWVRSAPAPRFCASLPICVGEVVRRVEWTGGWRRGRAGWTTDGDSGRCAAGREMTPRSLPNLGPCQNGRSLDSCRRTGPGSTLAGTKPSRLAATRTCRRTSPPRRPTRARTTTWTAGGRRGSSRRAEIIPVRLPVN